MQAESEAATYPEVVRIHMELVRVHRAQGGVNLLDVVHALHSILQPTHHHLTVLHHISVSEDGGVGGQVAEGFEVSLSPRIYNQKPGMT